MDGPSPWRTGWRGRCPRCGEGRLYAKFLTIAERCPVCDLDFAFENVGDGAVPFLILLVGAVGVGLGAWVLLTFATPVWVPIMITTPVVTALTLYLLPRAKGLMISLQYVNKASDTGTDDYDA